MENEDGSEIIKVPDLKKFVIECFLKTGVNRTYSEVMANSIVGADMMGHRSHGIFRLDQFIRDGISGRLNINGEPQIEKETSATAWVDGDNSFGAIVGDFCMKIGIAKAKAVGAAIVVAHNSNNFGVAAHFSRQALKEGMICFAVSNSSALMLVTRAKHAKSGTNPISFSAPGEHGDNFVLDMATTVVSGGNIDIHYQNGEFIPEGWAMNAACLPETNGDVAQKTGKFLPLGSYEELGSYKGSGLSIMIDILCAMLGAAHYSDMVGIWLDTQTNPKANVGHCFIVINPKYFAPNFENRLSEFLDMMRNLESINPNEKVRVPGDKRKHLNFTIEETGGIWYPKYVVDKIKAVAEKLRMKCVPFLPKLKVIHLTPSQELAKRLELEKLKENNALGSTSTKEMGMSEDISVEEKDLTEPSLIIQDSSDWLCSINGGSTLEMAQSSSNHSGNVYSDTEMLKMDSSVPETKMMRSSTE